MGASLDESGGVTGSVRGDTTETSTGSGKLGVGNWGGRGVVEQPAMMVATTVTYAARRFWREGINRFMVR